MTISELIARFRDLHAKSTPGPWLETYGAQRDPVCTFPIAGAKGNEPRAFFIHGANGKDCTTKQEVDAALIIAMHTRLPEILDVLEKTLGERDAARTERDTYALSVARIEQVQAEHKDAMEGLAYLRRMEADGGKIEVSLDVAHQLVCRMTDAMRMMLGDAKNYVECHLGNESGEKFLFTIRRRDGKTPHQMQREAEAARDAIAEAARTVIAKADARLELSGAASWNPEGVDFTPLLEALASLEPTTPAREHA